MINRFYLSIQANRGKYLLFAGIFLVHVFFRFYDLENRIIFGWDQVDNAWAVKDILVDHKLVLQGMVAKQNSGFYVGPLYYYYVAFFYLLFNFDPIASGFIAAFSSIITFIVLFFVTYKFFGEKVAFVAIFLHAISFHVINYEMIQWPINFLHPVSLLIFYFLYKTIIDDIKYSLALAIFLGLSFHLNFTAVYFPIIILLCCPFLILKKQSLKYGILCFLILVLFLLPNIIYEFLNKGYSSNNMLSYVLTYFHGFHFRRVLQLASDALLEVGAYLNFYGSTVLRFFVLPLFFVLLFSNYINRNILKTFQRHKNFINLLRKIYKVKELFSKIVFSYLLLLFFAVPWFVISVYSGEITDYYFGITRAPATILIAYILAFLLNSKKIAFKFLVIGIFVVYSFNTIDNVFRPVYRPLSYHRTRVLESIKKGRKIEFKHGVAESYIYYYYTELRKSNL